MYHHSLPQRGSPQRGSGSNSRNVNHLSHHHRSGPSEWGTSNNFNSHQHHYPPPPPKIRNHYDNYQHQQEMIHLGVPEPDYISIRAQAPNLHNVGGATIKFGDSNTEVTTKNAAELQVAAAASATGPIEGVAKIVHTNHPNNDDDDYDGYNHDHMSGSSQWGTSNNFNSHHHHYPPPPPPIIRNRYDNYQHQQDMIRLGVPKSDYMSISAQALSLRNMGGARIKFGDSNTEVVTTKHAAELQAAGPTEGFSKTVYTNHSNNDDDQDDYNHDHDDYDDTYDDDKDIKMSIGGVDDVPPHLYTAEKEKYQHTNASAYPNVDMTNDFYTPLKILSRLNKWNMMQRKCFQMVTERKPLIIKQL